MNTLPQILIGLGSWPSLASPLRSLCLVWLVAGCLMYPIQFNSSDPYIEYTSYVCCVVSHLPPIFTVGAISPPDGSPSLTNIIVIYLLSTCTEEAVDREVGERHNLNEPREIPALSASFDLFLPAPPFDSPWSIYSCKTSSSALALS